MKILHNKRALSNLLMLSALLSPTLAMADPDTVEAIHQMDSHVTGKLDEVKGSVDGVKSEVSTSNTYLQNISQKADISNKDMVVALMNYWANLSIKQFGLDQEKYFQVAPSTDWAIKVGSASAGVQSASNSAASKIANTNMLTNLGFLAESNANISILGVPIAPEMFKPLDSLNFYNGLKKFFAEGKIEDLGAINASNILLKNTLAKEDADNSQAFVNVITNPFPVVDAELTQKIKNNTLNGEDEEKIGVMVAQYALFGVSTNAWAGIISRRLGTLKSDGTPDNDKPSLMQFMDDAANQRFGNAAWYAMLSDASQEALLREVTHMLAYNQWQDFQQYKLLEQQVSLLASINAVMAKLNTSMDAMTAEMKKAQAEAKIQVEKAKADAAEAAADAQAEADKAAAAAGTTP